MYHMTTRSSVHHVQTIEFCSYYSTPYYNQVIICSVSNGVRTTIFWSVFLCHHTRPLMLKGKHRPHLRHRHYYYWIVCGWALDDEPLKYQLPPSSFVNVVAKNWRFQHYCLCWLSFHWNCSFWHGCAVEVCSVVGSYSYLECGSSKTPGPSSD